MSVPGPPFDRQVPDISLAQHMVVVRDTDSPRKWLECQDCPWTSLWDGRELHVLLEGDPRYGHGGSW